MQEYDVVIAGSGPAGSTCAKALTDEGFSVLILEKEALPRYKNCSGVLFGQTQELIKSYFGVDAPAEVYCSNKYIEADDIREWDQIHGYVPYSWETDKDGRKFSRTYQNIWRNTFDKWLLDQSGAKYIDSARVKAFDASDSSVNVHVQMAQSKEPAVFKCKYLVGADGNASTVRRLLQSAQTTGPAQGGKMASFQSYYKLVSLGSLQKDSWTVFLMPDIGDFILCVHQKGDYLVLHVGGKDGRNLRDSMEKFKELLSRQFGVCLGEHWRDEGCKLDLLPVFLGEGRVLVTGEAAGFIYLNCEGISAAMDSGYRCGKAIAQTLKSGGKPAIDLYEEGCQDIRAHLEKCISQMRFFA